MYSNVLHCMCNLDSLFITQLTHLLFSCDSPFYSTDDYTSWQWRSDGGAGHTGWHLLGAANAKGRKTPKIEKNSHENSDCKFSICLRARKTKRYSCALLSAN